MRMNQVTLAVEDFDEAVAFYKAWGLNLIVSSKGMYARFENLSDLSTLSLHLSDRPLRSSTILYFEVEDVETAVDQLAASGITPVSGPDKKSWRWTEARYRDPSGNELCVYAAGEDRRFPPWRLSDAGDVHKVIKGCR